MNFLRGVYTIIHFFLATLALSMSITSNTSTLHPKTQLSYPRPPWQNIQPGKSNPGHISRGNKDQPGYWEMRSLKEAYPRVIKQMEYRRGDWAVLLKDQWFYWAGGRLLPYKYLKDKDKYDIHLFYLYQKGALPGRLITQSGLDRIKADAIKEQTSPLNRLPDLYNKLWDSYSKKGTYQLIKRIRFLGYKVNVHKYLVPILASLEKEIINLSLRDAEVKDFLSGLETVSGWYYRVIKGTHTRSYHSYGLALDLIPLKAGDLQMYWRWTREKTPEWWTTDYSQMWLPPLSVIELFEKYGFSWGGKWLFYDTIHFEYRPEIHIFNTLTPPALLTNTLMIK